MPPHWLTMGTHSLVVCCSMASKSNLSTKKAKKRSFEDISDAQLCSLQESVQNPNTIKAERKAERMLREYLTFIGEPHDFYSYDDEKLCYHLSKFWWAVHTDDDDYFKVGSLDTIRHALNRALKKKGKQFDITDDKHPIFSKCCKSFKDACADLKKRGKGFVKHTPEISMTGKQFLHRYTLYTFVMTIFQCKNCSFPRFSKPFLSL